MKHIHELSTTLKTKLVLSVILNIASLNQTIHLFIVYLFTKYKVSSLNTYRENVKQSGDGRSKEGINDGPSFNLICLMYSPLCLLYQVLQDSVQKALFS